MQKKVQTSRLDTVSSTVPAFNAATEPRANISMNVQNATKPTPLTSVREKIPHRDLPRGLAFKPKTSLLPTPIQVDLLSSLLKDYHDANYVIGGFTNGFKLCFEGSKSSFISDNSPTVTHNASIAHEKIKSEIKLNRIAGPFHHPPFNPFKVSPLALREKSESGKFRLLRNLSYPYNNDSVNANIPEHCSKVRYESLSDAIRFVQDIPQAWMAKVDIADAFRLIPINPSDYYLTGFHLDGYYFDKCLPMGCSSSCMIFERFSSSLKWILNTHYNVVNVVKVLDDFMFIGKTESLCALYLKSFINMCSLINIPIANHKTMGPTKKLTFLGIELDSMNMLARLPHEKLIRYSKNVDDMLNSSSCSLKTLNTITGQLQFSTTVIKAGRPFLRRLYDATIGLRRKDQILLLSDAMKSDLKIWKEFLSNYNGITLISIPISFSSLDIHLYSDSSLKGFGGVYGTRYIYGSFPRSWQKLDIQVLELYPVFLLINIFHKEFSNKRIIFHCDNASVVSALNKQTSKCRQMMSLLRPLILLFLLNNINFSSLHIPGKLNILCDKLSRNQITEELLRRHGMDSQATPIPQCLLPINFKIQ